MRPDGRVWRKNGRRETARPKCMPVRRMSIKQLLAEAEELAAREMRIIMGEALCWLEDIVEDIPVDISYLEIRHNVNRFYTGGWNAFLSDRNALHGF